jgi:hypothetical protein
LFHELGLVGLALMLMALGGQFFAAARAASHRESAILTPALQAACIGALAFSFFADTIWFKDYSFPWILLARAARLVPENVAAAVSHRAEAAIASDRAVISSTRKIAVARLFIALSRLQPPTFEIAPTSRSGFNAAPYCYIELTPSIKPYV